MNYMYNWIDVIFFKIIWKNLVGWNEKKNLLILMLLKWKGLFIDKIVKVD